MMLRGVRGQAHEVRDGAGPGTAAATAGAVAESGHGDPRADGERAAVRDTRAVADAQPDAQP